MDTTPQGTGTGTAANATAQGERAALCTLFLRMGPDASTLCAGWTTRDLAAHLVVRERRPDAAVGIVIPPLAGWTARVQEGVARQGWADLVEQVRTGPPRWSPMAVAAVDGASNTLEFFVHHEDVRRAAPDWSPRTLNATTTAQLWDSLSRGARLLTRHSPVGVVLRPTDGPGAGAERRLRDGERTVALTGPVGECALALFGRTTAGLTIEGTDADVAAFHAFDR